MDNNDAQLQMERDQRIQLKKENQEKEQQLQFKMDSKNQGQVNLEVEKNKLLNENKMLNEIVKKV